MGGREKEAKHKPIKSRKCNMGVHKFPFMKTSVFFKQTAKWPGSQGAQRDKTVAVINVQRLWL